ncbi:MAG: class A beta-lactamase [Pseudomonadota bacterium]
MRDVAKLTLTFLTLVAVAALTLARASDERSVYLANTLSQLEHDLNNRLGVFVLDTATGRLFGYRADERFATASAFKVLLAGVVLARAEAGDFALDDTVSIEGVEIQPHSPLIDKLDGSSPVSLAALCQAAVELSDNTATNLLLAKLGGPAGFTAQLRELGDATTRIDRWEIELNTNLPGDDRDTSSPAAMATTLASLLDGSTLTDEHTELLGNWLRGSKTGLSRLRAGLPNDWDVGDKTGTGQNGAVNDVAVIWPPNDAPPVIVAVLMDGGTADFATHNAAHAKIGQAVAAWLAQSEREQQLSHSTGMR